MSLALEIRSGWASRRACWAAPSAGVLVVAPQRRPIASDRLTFLKAIKASAVPVVATRPIIPRTLSLTPPCLREVKNPGPTCMPRVYTKSMSPKFWARDTICGSSLSPVRSEMWPRSMPAKKTRVTPRLTPLIFICPSARPREQIRERYITACRTLGSVSSSLNQFISI